MKNCMMGIAAVGVLAAAGNAEAARIRINSDGFNVAGGGEFRVTVISGNAGSTDSGNRFRSFCLETSESVEVGGSVYDAEVRRSTQGSAGSNALTSEVAFLYTQFRNRSLSEYNFADADTGGLFANRRESAFALQTAIWDLMGVGGHVDTNNYYYQLANNAVASGQWEGLGNVRVLSLRGGPGGNADGNNQDILTLVPLPGTAGTAIAGLLGIAAFRRRR